MAYEGEPQQIVLWFLGSKDSVVLVRDRPVVDGNGVKKRRCFMAVPEAVRWRYNIKDEDEEKWYKGNNEEVLTYNKEGGGSAVCAVREYKEICFDYSDINPEDPRVAVSCNFDGTDIVISDKLKVEVESLRNVNAQLREQNNALRKELMEVNDAFMVYRKKFGHSLGQGEGT